MKNTSTKIRATLVILDFFKAPQVCRQVAQLLKQKGISACEIFVVDNSCSSQNARLLQKIHHPRVHIIINSQNLGYPRANNLAAARGRGDFIFLLNPDLEWPDTSSLQKILTHLQKNPRIGALGVRQRKPDHTDEMTVRGWPKFSVQVLRRTILRHLPLVRASVARDEMQTFRYSRSQNVEWLQSSFLATPRALWQQLGGLSEKYFLFMADTDYCWRTWQSGHTVHFLSTVTLGADGQRCSEGGLLDFFRKKTLRLHFRDALRYFFSHFLRRPPFTFKS